MASLYFKTAGARYEWVLDSQSYANAVTAAQVAGGTLLAINSQSEQDFIYGQVSAVFANQPGLLANSTAADGGNATYLWLGASDALSEGTWVWESGEAFTYTNWGSAALGNEPDDYQGQDGLALGLENWPSGAADGAGFGDAGGWNDVDLSNQLTYIIEYDTGPITGTAGNDTLTGTYWADKISGLGGKDKLLGGNGNDVLKGGAKRDKLYGGKGKDDLNGGKGNDILKGNAGADTFFFKKGDGKDTIKDFELGKDLIEIGKGAGRLGQLDFEQSGDDVVVSFANVVITVENSIVSDLQDGDNFLF